MDPLPHYWQSQAWFAKYASTDGYVYPPVGHTKQYKPGWKRPRKVPQSERPLLLHRLPTTHELTLSGSRAGSHTARRGKAGLVMYLLGAIYGYRCHFHDWWVDGRVPNKPDLDHWPASPEQAALIIDKALATWSQWPLQSRRGYMNLLYLHPRAACYETEWERFQAEYQVFDSISAVASRIKPFADRRHGQRFYQLGRRFRIPMKRPLVTRLVRLRNNLVHEGIWDGGMPGEARRLDSYYASLWLHSLTSRLLLALLGVRGVYVQSGWWGLGAARFEVQ